MEEHFPRKGIQPMGRGPEEGENVTFWGLKKKSLCLECRRLNRTGMSLEEEIKARPQRPRKSVRMWVFIPRTIGTQWRF